jgi:excisionase family DNA binding protein
MTAPDLRTVCRDEADLVWSHGGMTVRGAAEFLGISRRSIYNLISDQRLASTRVSGRRLVPKRQLVDLLRAGEGGTDV